MKKIREWLHNAVENMAGRYASLISSVQNIKLDRNALIFIGFLGLSMFFWFLQALNKEYQTELKYPVKYADYPKEFIIEKDLSDKLTIEVKDLGFSLLRYKLTSSFIPISFNLRTLIYKDVNHSKSGHAYITSDALHDRIEKQLSSSTELLQIKPDSIHIYYSRLLSKKVPIYPHLKIETEKQYILSGAIEVKPDSVLVFGPRNIIDTLQSVLTKNEAFDELDDTLIRNISLKDYKDLDMDLRRVVITIPVEPFTEKTITVPVVGKSFPDSLNIRTFPGLVDVSFFVGLSNYNDIRPEDLIAYIDYDEVKNASRGSASIHLEVNSKLISNPRLSANALEYLVEFTSN